MSVENYQILPLQVENLAAVLAIERQSYLHPWSAEQFVQELENPIATVELIWLAGELAGYICYWLIDGELQILNIATAPRSRRQGIAGRLLTHVFSRCADKGLDRAWLEVRTSNKAAITLYRQQGFVDDVVRTGYYRDGEDALLMVRDFSTQNVPE
jgi:ribosomal-protein-alanine N-acetyltransferase